MSFCDRAIVAPSGIKNAQFILRPIVADDAELDYEAVMESRDFLRLWEQSSWPEDDFTVEANRDDLIKLEQRHSSGESFAYTVLSTDETECLGCVYIFAPDANWFADARIIPTGKDRWTDVDAMVAFWVRKSRLLQGLDRLLLSVLQKWFEQTWDFEAPVFFTNEQFEQQMAMIEGTGLRRRFEAKLRSDEGRYVLYA